MTIAELWTWLTTGHRHAAASTGLAPALTGELGRWTMPLEDE